jgi:hypothetical protein
MAPSSPDGDNAAVQVQLLTTRATKQAAAIWPLYFDPKATMKRRRRPVASR